MKRSYWMTLFLVMGICLFAKGVFGWALKSVVSVVGSCKLTYRSLSFDGKGISLHNPIFLDLGPEGKSRFHLHADLLWIGWDQGIVWYAEAPRLTLSPELLQEKEAGFSLPFRGQAVRGLLDWKGGDFPPIHFEYQNDGEDHLQFYMDPIVFSWRGICFKGESAILDWDPKQWKMAISHLIIEGEEGAHLEIEQARASFEQGVGGGWDWEGKGVLASDRILCTGKGTFSSTSISGEYQFGNLNGHIQENRIQWNQFGPLEGKFLQNLLASAFPKLKKISLESGVISGTASLDGFQVQLEEILATNLSLGEMGFASLQKNEKGFQVEGGWVGDFGKGWSGFVSDQADTFHLTGEFFGQKSVIQGAKTPDQMYCLQGNVGWIEDFFCFLDFSQDQINIETLRGAIALPQFTEPFQIWSPSIVWKEGKTHFDIRLERNLGEWLRLAGTENKGSIQLDDSLSHFLQTPLRFEQLHHSNGMLDQGTIDVKLSAEKVSLALSAIQGIDPQWIQGDAQIELSFAKNRFDLSFQGSHVRYKNWVFPISANLFCQDSTFAFHLNQGILNWDAQGNLHIDRLPFSLSLLHPSLSGDALATGGISFGKDGIEGDWEVVLSKIAWDGKEIEWHAPLQVFHSSREGLLLKGVEGTLRTEFGPAFAKAHLIQVLPQFELIRIEKGHLHCPVGYLQLPFLQEGSVDCWGDFETDWKGENFRGALTEATSPLRIEQVEIERRHGFFSAKGRWNVPAGPVDWAFRVNPTHKGTLYLAEPSQEKPPLAIQATFYPSLQIESAIGTFAGVDLYFQAPSSDSRLIGTAQVDFSHLAAWVPPEIRKAFVDLEMGQGHTLKGTVVAPNSDWQEATFQGVWTGKNCELFGYELRSLFATTSFSQHHVHVNQLSVIDPAGAGSVDQILIQEEKESPWTLHIPKITLIDLRPSLLHKKGEDPKPLTPLLVRRLELGPVEGLAAEGATYRGNGTLDFINSFKREKSILDWPSHLFGRIIGLDLDLMTPARGTLDFELRGGYYWLTRLKEAYSENERSQFFLVEDPPPRMDLDGNLEIVIQMKQYVLFKITDAFVITIDGKLNDPKIRLQKKSRFL